MTTNWTFIQIQVRTAIIIKPDFLLMAQKSERYKFRMKNLNSAF